MTDEEMNAVWEAVEWLLENERRAQEMTEKIRIRMINGPMPFDKDGKHATGREVWTQAAAGNWVWAPEFEGDDTEDMPETEEVIS